MTRFALTALILLAAGPLAAQTVTDDAITEDEMDEPAVMSDSAMTPPPADDPAREGVLISANAMEGAVIYSLAESYDETFWDTGESFGAVASAWIEIGEVEDVVLNDIGDFVGVTVDVGGFLGIGRRAVLLNLDDIRLVQLPDDDGFYIVTRMSEDEISNAPEMEDLAGED